MDLPEGTLSFFCTDIESSSHLWEADSKAMKASLALHDAIMIQEIRSYQGTIFKRAGDAFFAVFPTAVKALECSIAVQKRLNEPPPEGMLALKTRIAIHTGNAELRENDYYGPTVNRASRILNLAQGGQVLLSEVSAGLCQDHVQPNVELLEIGKVTLKSMTRPERIFQLFCPDLPNVFSPLRSNDQDMVESQPLSFSELEKEAETTKAILSRAQQVSAPSINRENLLRTAAELGISASAVAKAELEYRQEEGQRRLRLEFFQAKRAKLMGEYMQALSMTILIIGIWYFSRAVYFWPAWVVGWFWLWPLTKSPKYIKDGPHLDASFAKWQERRLDPNAKESRRPKRWEYDDEDRESSTIQQYRR